MTTRLLHCEQHHLFADALADVMRDRGHEITWVSGPEDACRLDAAEFDVCVTGTGFPDVTVPDLICRLREASQASRLVVLTPYEDPALAALALRAGADAVIAKTAPIAMTLQTIDGARLGNVTYATPATKNEKSSTAVDWAMLTPREHEVLRELANGYSTDRIADNLGVARTTARTYIQNILTKFGVHSKAQAVAVAFMLDLVHPTALMAETASMSARPASSGAR